jgi:hypothetical protein
MATTQEQLAEQAQVAHIKALLSEVHREQPVDKDAVRKLDDAWNRYAKTTSGEDRDAQGEKLLSALQEIVVKSEELGHQNQHEEMRRRNNYKFIRRFEQPDHLGQRRIEYTFPDGCIETEIYETDADWMARLQAERQKQVERRDWQVSKARERLDQRHPDLPDEIKAALDDPQAMFDLIDTKYRLDPIEYRSVINAMTPENRRKLGDLFYPPSSDAEEISRHTVPSQNLIIFEE